MKRKHPRDVPEADRAETPRLELDTEIVADLEAGDEETEAVRGGANYSRVASIAF